MSTRTPAPATAVDAAPPEHVAYVMSWFPKLTETFVLDEILEMQRQGVRVGIHPLRRGRGTLMHHDAQALVAEAQYRPLLDLGILRDNLIVLLARPRAWLGCFADLVRANLPSPRYLSRAVLAFPRAVSLARRLPATRATHVHAHFASHPAAVAWVIARLSGLPYSFTAHGSDLHRDQTMLARKVAGARFVVTIAEFNRDFMAPHVAVTDLSRVHVIHCGIDVERFPRAHGRDGVFSFGCVGTLHEVKGQHVLLAACAQLLRRGLNFHCHFIGDGPDRAQLTARAAALGLRDQVTFHGACERGQVRELLSRLDVAVTPSVPTADGRREGIPVALMEAGACALPLVASRLSGIPEIVHHGATGLLVEPGDAEGLADALLSLSADPALRLRLGDAARALVASEFSLQRGVGRLRALMFPDARA
jgi:colanic acid/amylovoran biosynthesis glycosyltransferase